MPTAGFIRRTLNPRFRRKNPESHNKRTMPGEPVIIVSGLPRSGTSLMMQMLQAGGLSLLTDGVRQPDESNPQGYFELERVKMGKADLGWLESAPGRVVKVIHLLLTQLPVDRDYRVVLMVRHLDEVIASQRAMLQQQGRTFNALNDAAMAGIFGKQLVVVRQWLAAHPNFRVLEINHSEVITHPLVAAEKINDFLGGNLRTGEMAASVQPSLYRQRKLALSPSSV